MKFQRGLNPQIQDAIATMAYRCPSDTSPDSWYEAAKIIDQNCTANKAFNSACQPPIPVTPGHDLPTLALNSCLIVHESTNCPLMNMQELCHCQPSILQFFGTPHRLSCALYLPAMCKDLYTTGTFQDIISCQSKAYATQIEVTSKTL